MTASGVSSSPILTIVTVVRDDPQGLAETADSIVTQRDVEFHELEWIIVDSSTETSHTIAVVKALEPRVPTRVDYQAPSGIYAAMNAGLDAATGTYVLFLNAGDTFASDHVVGQLIAYLAVDEAPQWLVGRVRIIDQAGRKTDSAQWEFHQEKKHLFARGAFPPHQGTVMRTEVLRSIGRFDQRFRIAADYHAALKVSQISSPLMVNTIVAEFREGGASTVQWKHAMKEFHQARVEVFRPTGMKRLREMWRSAEEYAKRLIYRDVLRGGR